MGVLDSSTTHRRKLPLERQGDEQSATDKDQHSKYHIVVRPSATAKQLDGVRASVVDVKVP